MPNMTTAARSAMQRLRTLFHVQSPSNKKDLRHAETLQVESAEIAGIHAALERNSRDLRYVFDDVRGSSEFLRQQLKNKKLNRAELADDLFYFAELADYGRSLLRDRMRLEQRISAHCCGYPATANAQKTKQTSRKAGSHG